MHDKGVDYVETSFSVVDLVVGGGDDRGCLWWWRQFCP
jgi:hypothetical protein